MGSVASSSSSSTMSSKVRQLVESSIDDNYITVFSKTYCPYCRRAKTLLNSLELPAGKTIKVLELDERRDGPAIQQFLEGKTGQSTVPNIYINRQHIGGSDDLAALQRSGELKKILDEAAASA